jgi:SGNH domain (fused to AT3 domains)
VVIDPTSWFCADDKCLSVIGNYLVYRDQSHVTASCMRFLVPELSACCRSQPDSRFPSMGVVQ